MREMNKYAGTRGEMYKYPKTVVVSKNRGFAFSFEKYGAINLLFLLTILKIGTVLSKGPNEAVKGPK